MADARNLGANLIVHHRIAEVFDQAAEFVHIPGTIQEPRDLASLFQRDELLKNLFQFPSKWRTSVQVSTVQRVGYLLRTFLP